ncbi:SDR family oxidoreductase [Sphingomonas sp. SUN019]|uniref:SDR family oxidoreductase n=1 Tax=Sphingomonas sp. SUN019 TaxID=2937788 RepID=UPI0021644B4D|nr:SDR family oxidoreductase [Sphingomonas sp. SUN019]UVO51384.1 SDR family oxidoreductase [Sphingomonas sp. SUN019]
MKAILITGGGSGIGRAVAQHFAAQGWRVGLADINERGLAETAALLPADRTTIHPMDVRSIEDWEETLAAFTKASGGRLDVLFNNAGIGQGGPYGQIALDELDRVIDINFRGVAYGARAAYPYLKATPDSCLLNTASASAIYGSAGLALYSATKFAVRGLTEALDGEWAADGIKVRDLMPGFIDTPILSLRADGSNRTARDAVVDAGLEFTPIETVAQAAWDAVHGDKVHAVIGKTARRLTFAARWTPGRLRKLMRSRVLND